MSLVYQGTQVGMHHGHCFDLKRAFNSVVCKALESSDGGSCRLPQGGPSGSTCVYGSIGRGNKKRGNWKEDDCE